MSVKISLGALAAFVLAAMATTAKAEVPSCVAIDDIERVTVAVDGVSRCFYKFDDRFYEVLVEAGISWDLAKQRAAARKGPNSLVGGLATATDPEEDAALFQMAKQNQPSGSRTHAWIGGQQNACATPACGWVTVHGQEIPEENNSAPTSFAAWQLGQPDDRDGTENGEQNHLAIGKNPGWTDEAPGNVYGWINEYGDEIQFNFADCVGGTGCNPTGLLRTKFPLTTAGGDVGSQTRYRITDLRFNPLTGACNQVPLELDLEPPVGIDVRVPPELCAYIPADAPAGTTADFILIRFKAPGAVVSEGLIELFSTVDAESTLPPTRYGCNPVHPLTALKEDLVTHQRSDVSNDILKDVTHGCINPPRGGTYRPSWFGVGLTFNTALGTGDPVATRDFLILRQRRNLEALLATIATARAAGVISSPVARSIETKINTALSKHNTGAYQNALDSLRQADKLNIQAAVSGTPENLEGQIVSSLLNAIDLYQRRWFTLLK